MSLGAYEWQMTGTGPTFWEQQRRKVDYPECGVVVAAGLLLKQLQSKKNVGQGGRGGEPPPPPGEAQTYQVSFPKRLLRLRCPVEG